MNKPEYLRAVRQAPIILGYIAISDKRRAAIRLSKNKARQLARLCTDSDTIDAEWTDDDHTALLVG